jgi:hypothetical protein
MKERGMSQQSLSRVPRTLRICLQTDFALTLTEEKEFHV